MFLSCDRHSLDSVYDSAKSTTFGVDKVRKVDLDNLVFQDPVYDFGAWTAKVLNEVVAVHDLHVYDPKSWCGCIYRLKNGETEANKLRIIQGQQDTELSDKGRKQAYLCGQRLQHWKFTHVYSSDLKRAYETGQIILQNNKACQCEITVDDRLRERKFGELEGAFVHQYVRLAHKQCRKSIANFTPEGGETLGQSFGTLEGSLSVDAHAAAKNSGVPINDYCPPGGEALTQVRGRAVDFFQELCQKVLRLCDTSVDADTCTPSATPAMPVLEKAPEEGAAYPMTELSNMNRDQLTAHSLPLSLTDHFKSKNNGGSSNSCLPSTDMPPPPVPPYGNAPAISHMGGIIQQCPNVSLSMSSLSPNNQCMSSISSISSGHDSFDDGDDIVPHVADVLLVSHGGLIKEMICYFQEHLGCVIPGVQGNYLTTPYNTSLSTFVITVGDFENLAISCLSINDKMHLASMEIAALEKTAEV